VVGVLVGDEMPSSWSTVLSRAEGGEGFALAEAASTKEAGALGLRAR